MEEKGKDQNVEALLKRAVEGNPDAFWALVQQHEQMLFAVALGILKDGEAAQDVVHDVYVRAFSTLGNLRSSSRLGSWLYTMTRNLAFEYLRKVERQRKIAKLKPPEAVISVPDMLIQEEEFRMMDEAMQDLPETHRVVLGLKYLNHMSCKEIAQTLGIGLEAAKSRLFEARKALRVRIKAAEKNAAHPMPSAHGVQNRPVNHGQ